MDQLRVVVADDHDVMRGLIRGILESDPIIEVVDEAADGAEVLELVKNLAPDVLVLDLQMPVLTGVEVIQSVRQENLPVKILVLSTFADPHYVRAVIEFGVAGYVSKDDAQEELVDAVVGVASKKQIFLSQKVKQVIHQ